MSEGHQSSAYHDQPTARSRSDALQDVDSVDLAANADSIWGVLRSLRSNHEEESSHYSRRMIAALFRLCMHMSSDNKAYKEFKMSRKAYSGRNDNLFFVVAAGIMRYDDPKKGKTLRSYYAQACILLQRNGVDPDNALDWLNEPAYDDSRDRMLTGLNKTIFLWSFEPEGIEARRKKARYRDKLAEGPIRYTLGSDYGAVGQDTAAADLTPLTEGAPGLALIEVVGGSPVLKNLLTTDPILMAPVIKQCLKRRAKKPEN